MRLLWILVGAFAGVLIGAAAGFGIALFIAKPQNDGTFGMREMIVCVPVGVVTGLLAGLAWGFTTHLGGA